MAWATIEDGLRAWVKTASGLADSQVIWADQAGARPAGAYITLQLGPIVALGACDEVETHYDEDADAGEEIELRVNGRRSFAVSIQAFTPSVTGASTARALLSTVQTALGLPSVRTALAAAGVTPFESGPVNYVPALVGTLFEGRATLEAQFYTRETVSEYLGYIDTVETENYLGPPDLGTRDDIDI